MYSDGFGVNDERNTNTTLKRNRPGNLQKLNASSVVGNNSAGISNAIKGVGTSIRDGVSGIGGYMKDAADGVDKMFTLSPEKRAEVDANIAKARETRNKMFDLSPDDRARVEANSARARENFANDYKSVSDFVQGIPEGVVEFAKDRWRPVLEDINKRGLVALNPVNLGIQALRQIDSDAGKFEKATADSYGRLGSLVNQRVKDAAGSTLGLSASSSSPAAIDGMTGAATTTKPSQTQQGQNTANTQEQEAKLSPGALKQRELNQKAQQEWLDIVEKRQAAKRAELARANEEIKSARGEKLPTGGVYYGTTPDGMNIKREGNSYSQTSYTPADPRARFIVGDRQPVVTEDELLNNMAIQLRNWRDTPSYPLQGETEQAYLVRLNKDAARKQQLANQYNNLQSQRNNRYQTDMNYKGGIEQAGINQTGQTDRNNATNFVTMRGQDLVSESADKARAMQERMLQYKAQQQAAKKNARKWKPSKDSNGNPVMRDQNNPGLTIDLNAYENEVARLRGILGDNAITEEERKVTAANLNQLLNLFSTEDYLSEDYGDSESDYDFGLYDQETIQ